MVAELVILSLLCWIPHQVAGRPRCKYNQFEIEDVFKNVSCHDCPSCPIGQGLSPECGSFVSYGTPIECKPCIPGKTYSNKEGILSCSPCAMCSDHQDVKRECNVTTNSVCGKGCYKGFYLDDFTDDCQPCSWCCGDGDDVIANECVRQGMPSYKQCGASRGMECTPKCSTNQYITVGPKRERKCVNCKTCPAGYTLTPKCGATIDGPAFLNCTRCEQKTFSDKEDSAPCKPCSQCAVGQIEERGCTPTGDTVCGKCKRGFYQSRNGECLQCSNCCGDEKDIPEKECIRQGMPPSQQCRFTDRSVEVCQKKNDKHELVLGIPQTGFITAGVLLPVFLLSAVIFYCIRRHRRKCRSQNYQPLESMTVSQDGCVESASSVEKPEVFGSPGALSFPKSGLLMMSDDPGIFEDQIIDVGVEICCEEIFFPKHDADEVLLSPVIKFHPHDQCLSKKVKLGIPHCASHLSPQNDWHIKVQKAKLTSHDSEVEWVDVPQTELEIKSNEVNVETSELLAFVVSGKADPSGGPAKKRMKCMAFAREAVAGQDFTVTLVLLDDCESSFEQVVQTEKQKGKTILGGIQSLHIEAFTGEPVRVEVQGISSGWTVKTPPTDITYEQWSKSFLKIPKEDITFHHADPSKWEFSCILSVHASNDSAEVPIYTYFQENPKIKRVHTQTAQQDSQDKEGPVMLNPNQTSTRLLSLPQDVRHQVCMLLDMPLRNVGHWRHVGRELGFSPEDIHEFGTENLKVDGSPTTKLLQVLLDRKPEFTVVKLVEILQTPRIKRYDVVQVLRPYFMAQQPENA